MPRLSSKWFVLLGILMLHSCGQETKEQSYIASEIVSMYGSGLGHIGKNPQEGTNVEEIMSLFINRKLGVKYLEQVKNDSIRNHCEGVLESFISANGEKERRFWLLQFFRGVELDRALSRSHYDVAPMIRMVSRDLSSQDTLFGSIFYAVSLDSLDRFTFYLGDSIEMPLKKVSNFAFDFEVPVSRIRQNGNVDIMAVGDKWQNGKIEQYILESSVNVHAR